ncbi:MULTISPECIES: carbon storage regulator CsrA [unclassified Brenneria]|uniref:carbon storage regulator CsrA n=1 Tax=unclassified Brenneria TaxID=2634434 RepID=UPI0018F0754A|nr:carbon storage regulator CsrA [Brenneria sp. L3-3C-1]MBJ7223493.1 carbon storage regulator CsrA [Brenneria sp. L3-3C-1]MEE3644733.1 carbon storage regulator CsrA [Brenneria sp. L3_3C_1]
MLILTRELGESLMIGDDIKVDVLRVEKSQARLGIHAPEGKRVYREEIYRRIKAESPENARPNESTSDSETANEDRT